MAVVDYSAQIAALVEAIGSGATSVSYEGKSVSYASVDKMIEALTFLERRQAAANGPARPVAGKAAFSRGYQNRVMNSGMIRQRSDEDC